MNCYNYRYSYGYGNCFVLLVTAICCLSLVGYTESKLPQDEVDALGQIVSKLGSKYWEFDSNTCTIQNVGLTTEKPADAESAVNCSCDFKNDTFCHVVRIALKRYNLPGVLPPELAELPHLREIDLSYNYLNGTIPEEWASMQLTFIGLIVNRLSGEIPIYLGKITSLTYICLEANQFSGSVPSELGNLINLQTLMLSSNKLTGKLPASFSKLVNLTDFRIDDNNFTGTIPEFIKNWKQLKRLEIHASGLEGPIPSDISVLSNLQELRISDIGSPVQHFPNLSNVTGLVRLVLRNCNISDEIPNYIWAMEELEVLDLSYNRLVGEIPDVIDGKSLRFVFLTSNLLSGRVPDSILKEGTSVDLSYNNFTRQTTGELACQDNRNLNLNLYRSSSVVNNLSRVLPCLENFRCPHYFSCLNVNCGGNDARVKENKQKFLYAGDGDIQGGTANYYLNKDKYWGFSSTGDFMDDNDYQNLRYTVSVAPSNLSELDSTARTAPISLAYFHYCLKNGNYTVRLRFSEIQFTNDSTYNSLGKRMFDVYVQDKLFLKDYNIVDAAGGVQKPKVEELNISVTNNMLDIRFYWAGKGTTRIPKRGVYGPLVSSISAISDFEVCSSHGKNRSIYIATGVGSFCLLVILLCMLWWKGYIPGKRKTIKGTEGLDVQARTFTLRQIKDATGDFDSINKIGEGGFGPVYKGQLPDGTVIAVKQLSSKSRQGNREFLNEIGIISCLQHPNLVKLHGCCIEGNQLLLVYEYMENNSLARALFGNHPLQLNWATRFNICFGIAKGLKFLHEESILKIVHRDIKATNVLLDKDLNPKISDFGLARLDEGGKTHISTKVAGTIGYMAPEYALWGYLTFKADVYSFGVVILEVVSGKNNSNYMPNEDFICLLDWACTLQQSGNLMELVDEKLNSQVNKEEVELLIRIAVLCTNASSSLRPTMSEVVGMLEGRLIVPDIIPEPSTYNEDLRFKAMRDLRHMQRHYQSLSLSGSDTQNLSTIHTFGDSTVSIEGGVDIKPESRPC